MTDGANIAHPTTAAGETGRDVARREETTRVRPRITLMQLLTFAFGGLMLVGLATVLVLSALANNRNTFNLLNDNAVLLMSALRDDIVATLEPSLDVVATVSDFYAEGRFGLEPSERRRELLEGILAGATHVDAIMIYPHGGEPSGIARGEAQGETIVVDRPGKVPSEVRGLLEDLGPGDPPQWGPPVFVDGETYVNVVAPLVRDGAGEGAVVLAMGTDEISRVVTRIARNDDATAFVLYGEEGVLARSGEASVYGGADPRTSGRPIVPFQDVRDPVLASWSAREPLPGFRAASREGVSVARITADDGVHMVVSSALEGFGPEPWTVGIYQPLSDFRQIIARLAGSIVAGVAILILSLVAVVLISRTIARVLGRTSQAARRIAALELERVEPLPRSVIRELDTEAHAFNAMRRGLADFARYVPRQLVERLIRDGETTTHSRHRAATVMFTDIVGFTSLSESLPAEEVAELLNRHFGLVVRCVSAEDGIVDKYLGDGVMAFWTDGEDDHAVPAVRAAIEIARTVAAEAEAARAAGETPLRLRIGLHTGEVIAGNVGPPDRVNFTIVGDTVNVASRLEQLGHDVAPGADCVILASETTVAHLPEDVPRSRIGSVHLRNRIHPLDVWRVHPAGGEEPAVAHEGEVCPVYDMRETAPPA